MKPLLLVVSALLAASLLVGIKISANLDSWYLCRGLGYQFTTCVASQFLEVR